MTNSRFPFVIKGCAAQIIERFEAKFERVPFSGCWLWNAGIFEKRGYGAFGHPEQLAHRVAWTLYRGPIPAGAHVLHRCDVRACVNPDHLFLGDQVLNMADKVSKGRQSRGAQHAERIRQALHARVA